MKASDYYPDGAYNDPNAPWNQKDVEPLVTEVCVSHTMSKYVDIPIHHYGIETWEDSEYDDEGHLQRFGGESYDFSDTCFEDEFNNTGLYTIPELIKELKSVATEKLTEATIKGNHVEIGKWACIKEACEGWVEDEFVVTHE